MIPMFIGCADESGIMATACFSVVHNDAPEIVSVHVQWQERFKRDSSVQLFEASSAGIEFPTLQMQNQDLRASFENGRL